MIKILLVEDEQEKRRLVTSALLEVTSITIENIAFAGDTYEAKRQLSMGKFDLLILDVNLPKRADQQISVGGGLDVLTFIKEDARAIVPSYVVGLTAYPDGAAAAQKEFSMPLWKLLFFSFGDRSWCSPLQEAVRYLCLKLKPPYVSDGQTFHSDVGIVVALEGVELQSIKKLPADWEQEVVRHDSSVYWRGKIKGRDKLLDVVLVAAPRMGMSSAAVTATKLIASFRPRILAMTGICAGIRGRVNIGDLLIADPCFDWGSGKWVVDENSKGLLFQPAAYPWRLDERLRAASRATANSPRVLAEIYESFEGAKPTAAPQLFIDAMATGASVLQSQKVVSEVREQHKNLIGIEMESYAVFSAAAYASDPKPLCISIKSACDFGDDDKSDGFQAYSAHVSAQFLWKLAELHWPLAEQ